MKEWQPLTNFKERDLCDIYIFNSPRHSYNSNFKFGCLTNIYARISVLSIFLKAPINVEVDSVSCLMAWILKSSCEI